jgi:chromosomal replication initiator protein
MYRTKPFACFVSAPENRAALTAMKDLATLADGCPYEGANPIYLHGPAGTGKSHLVASLIGELSRNNAGLIINVLEAVALARASGDDALPENAHSSDLLVLEDLQHLPVRGAERLSNLIDYRLNHKLPLVCTASVGPGHLSHRGERFPNRLTSRLASGLVIELHPLQATSRLLFLEEQARKRQLALSREVLVWLSENLTGGARELEGALNQLDQLARLHRPPLDLATVARSFRDQAEAGRPTIERIALRVSGFFQVAARQLQSRRRYRDVLLPRQVGMYLTRKLTGMSLEQIGIYFGGRDHTTVLHACRKVEQAMRRDTVLCGVVRRLRADLA